jgi:small GTP-binding protein
MEKMSLPSGDFQLKTVFLGAISVGKTSIMLRFAKDEFLSGTSNTAEVDILRKELALPPRTTLKFDLWDTAGHERFESIPLMYYRDAHIAIIVYDITSQDSFDKAKRIFEEVNRNMDSASIVIAFVGNKCDLAAERQVETQKGQSFAEQHNLIFKETSAKDNINITQVFLEAAQRIPPNRLASCSLQVQVQQANHQVQLQQAKHRVQVQQANPQAEPHQTQEQRKCRCNLI